MSPRTVHFQYEGWPYQVYLRSLKERGMQEPAVPSRCDVLAGVLWMAKTILWRKTFGKKVLADGDGKNASSVIELIGIIGVFLGIAGLIIASLVGGIQWGVEEFQYYAPLGAVQTAFHLVSPLAIGVTAFAVLIGAIIYADKKDINPFEGVVIAFRWCRETIHFFHEMLHQRVEGTLFCPLVTVTGRPDQQAR